MESAQENPKMNEDRESNEAGEPCAGETIGTTRSRRYFLASTVPGLALTAAWPANAALPPAQNEMFRSPHPLEDVLRRYGSEFGDLTRLP
jgi:hypothetical protein